LHFTLVSRFRSVPTPSCGLFPDPGIFSMTGSDKKGCYCEDFPA
jgi:hypothetical protein